MRDGMLPVFLAGSVAGAFAAYIISRVQSTKQQGVAERPVNSCQQQQQPTPLPPLNMMENLLDDEILTEQFTRNVQFFGREGQQQVANAFVVVVGLGGVGSHAAHMLLRSGVGKLRLVDFDQVSVSSLNRHAVAVREDVGLPKACCLKEHFHRILPEADVEAINTMYTEEAEAQLLAGRPDFVLDAIDNIDTKVALLAACHRRGIPVLSSAGAGAKADPTRVRIADISECSGDPLARAVRFRLRRDHGIISGFDVVLSLEKPRCKLVDAGEAGSNPLDYQIVPGFRIRTVPVLGTLPSLFGMAAASHMLCQLAGQPINPEPLMHLPISQYEAQLARLQEREELKYGSAEGVGVDLQDVVYLVRDVWRNVSARTLGLQEVGDQRGFGRSTANLVLTRWDASQHADIDNLVLLTFDEADRHDEQLEEQQDAEVQQSFERYVASRLRLVQSEYQIVENTGQ